MLSKGIKIFIFSISFCSLFAQSGNIPLGTWRAHPSLNLGNVLEMVDQFVYCGTSGGLYYLDKDDNSLHVLGKQQGLNDIYVTSLKYCAPLKTLVIGYESGNIDLLIGNRVINIPFIYSSNIIGSKRINDIFIYKNNAYLSCDFGIVVLNLARQEVKESYLNIGKNGTVLSAYSSVVLNDSLFIATSQGILAAHTISTNLLDFKNWNIVNVPDSLLKKPIVKITSFNNLLAVGLDSTGIYIKNGGWKKLITINAAINSLNNEVTTLYAGLQNGLIKINNTNAQFIQNKQIGNVTDIIADLAEAGVSWLINGNNGIVRLDSNQNMAAYLPNGPISNNVFNLRYSNNLMFSFQGGYDKNTTPLGKDGTFSYFNNNTWSQITPFTNNANNFQDVVDVTYNPAKSQYIFATDVAGALIFDSNFNFLQYINAYTSTCRLKRDFTDRVTSTMFDVNTNNTWICNITPETDASGSIYKLKDSTICDVFYIPIRAAHFPEQIVIDNADNKWVRLVPAYGGGVLVFNETQLKGNVPQYIYYSTGVGNGNLPSGSVYCMAKDLNGDIWLGTDHGVAVVYNPASSLSSSSNDAVTPIFQNHPLLFDQLITCMDVDGGNRKWIGTGNGIYLLEPDGTHQVYYFNASNSPLLSNNILAVSVNQITGEVFIGTDKGLVSFREAATTGNDSPSQISIFPNPVKTDYVGLIGFSGLGTNASVKITDISGRLVYEVKANGGSASWNGRDYNGKKISPGVYVVLTSKDDGTSPATGKIFVLD